MSTEAVEILDVFLSHAHVDAALVEALAKRLEDSAGLRVWLDKWVLVPGESWQQAMAKGLDQANSCAVCIGEKTPSGWFQQEIERALNRQARDKSFRVIPVLLPEAQKINVDNFLELRTWVDFGIGLADPKSFHILVSGIKGVAPGRGPEPGNYSDAQHVHVLAKLRQLREIRNERLIDDEIALEYQRRLLDQLIQIER